MSVRHVLVECPQQNEQRIVFDRDNDTEFDPLILSDTSNFDNLFRFLTDVELIDEI